MRLLTRQLPENHNLFLFGDLHIGSTLFHKEGFDKMCEMVNGSYKSCSNNYGVAHGDLMESIMIDDPRFQPEATRGDPLIQIEEVVNTLQPIKNRIVVILQGNHEQKLWKFGDITKSIARQINSEYGTYSCHITYTDKNGKVMYKQYATHGSKGVNSYADDVGRRVANMELIIKRHMKDKFGDTILCTKGHSHKLLICKPSEELYLTVNDGGIKQHYRKSKQTDTEIHPDHKWYVNTGSFMRLYGDEDFSGYAERWELNPNELGFAIAVVRDGLIQSVDKIVV